MKELGEYLRDTRIQNGVSIEEAAEDNELSASQLENIENGNVIIAAHSGNSSISFFKNLPKLNFDDNAIIYYQGKTYTYKLVNNYEIEKTGTANIKRNLNKNSLTLITCKHNSNKQLVYIFELENIE